MVFLSQSIFQKASHVLTFSGYVCVSLRVQIWLYNRTEPAICLLNISERLICTVNKAGTFCDKFGKKNSLSKAKLNPMFSRVKL